MLLAAAVYAALCAAPAAAATITAPPRMAEDGERTAFGDLMIALRGTGASGERARDAAPPRILLESDMPRLDSRAGQASAALKASDLGTFAFTVLKREPEGAFVRRLTSDPRAGFDLGAARPASAGGISTIPLPAGIWLMLAGLAIVAGGWRFHTRRGRRDNAPGGHPAS